MPKAAGLYSSDCRMQRMYFCCVRLFFAHSSRAFPYFSIPSVILRYSSRSVSQGLQILISSQLFCRKQLLFSPKYSAFKYVMLRFASSCRQESCFLCNKIHYNMKRYYATFFHLIKEEDFRKKVENSNGLCLCHMEKLLDTAGEYLANGQREWFYATLSDLQRKHFARIQEDLDWFIEKFDYRNASADWKNSKDAVSRTMQKLAGIYPADQPFKQN